MPERDEKDQDDAGARSEMAPRERTPRPAPEQRAREWVSQWLAAPVLDGATMDEWLTAAPVPFSELIRPELERVTGIAFERFAELEAETGRGTETGAGTEAGARSEAARRKFSLAAPTSDKSVRTSLAPQTDETIRSKATVVWARARGLEPVGQDGRPATASPARPSWWLGWKRYTPWLHGKAGNRGWTVRQTAWQQAIALWDALGHTKQFRHSLVTQDGIDLSPIVLPVLARVIEEDYPEAVFSVAVTGPAPGSPPDPAPKDSSSS